jgi:hypothetical protein
MAGRRAPGGGRKPIGATPARSLLTIRMPDDLRAALEAAAGKNGRSLTQELIRRLAGSLRRDQIDRHDRITGALGGLVSVVANSTPRPAGAVKWHRDPFAFQVFRLSVAKVLDALQPPGELRSPFADVKPDDPGYHATEWARTPESAAAFVAAHTLDELFRPKKMTVEQKARLQDHFPEHSRSTIEAYEREFYIMDQIGRVLGIKQSPVLGIRPRESKR